MKGTLVALLLVAVVLGARNTITTRTFKKSMEEVKKTFFGATLMELITLHSAVAGPV